VLEQVLLSEAFLDFCVPELYCCGLDHPVGRSSKLVTGVNGKVVAGRHVGQRVPGDNNILLRERASQ